MKYIVIITRIIWSIKNKIINLNAKYHFLKEHGFNYVLCFILLFNSYTLLSRINSWKAEEMYLYIAIYKSRLPY